MNIHFHSVLAVCLVLEAPAAFAAKITVELTGHVTQITDPSNLLGGQVSVGQPMSGSYSYDTSVAEESDTLWTPEWARYPQSSTQASLALTVGTLAFESDPASPSWWFAVDVHDQPSSPMSPWSASDSLSISYNGGNKPLQQLAIDGSSMTVQFSDFGGSALQSEAMLAGAPDLSVFTSASATVQGWNMNGNFEVVVQIDSARNGGGDMLTVSPGSGPFVREQPIVPALLLPFGTVAFGIDGAINGNPMPGFFSSCMASSSQTRTIFVCPEVSPYLLPGMNHVEWRLQTADGSLVAKVVDWELVQ